MDNKKNTDLALLAYLLPIAGWLYVLLLHKNDEFAVYHAKQALSLTLFAVGLPLVWAVGSWLFLWIPYGGLIAAYAFSLVIGAYFGLFIAWLFGVANALKAETKPVPFFGGWLA